MKEKRVVIMLFVLLVLISLINLSAQDDAVDKGYDCLKTKLGNNCGDVKSTEQNAFNLLAMAHDSTIHKNCKDKLLEKKQANNCWGDSGSTACNVKSTALAILALNYVDEEVTDYVEYLNSKTKTVTDLTWFLQIDASNETDCTINGKKVTILENKKIRGQNPTGLTVAYNGYWYKVNDLTKNYTITCDRDFITALVYQRPGSTTYHISSETHYASAHDSTIERVKAECFTISGVCDYESSLWATLSLATAGEEVSPYIPYLLAMSEDAKYRNLLPAAFLYMLYGSSDEYYTSLVQQQKQNKYWDVSGNKFYDTSIALLALGDYGYDVVDNGKEYLLSVQGGDGCWGSSTALILHAGWPKLPTSSDDDDDDDGGTLYCDRFGFFCISQGECPATDLLDEYRCISSVDVCCESKPADPTCSEKNGEVCGMDEECSNNEYIISSDTSYCCGSFCEERVVEENLCLELGYNCKEQCGADEVQKESYNIDCGFDVCCGPIEDTGGTNWLWIIILLIILIILVVLAIVFKDQLRVALFKKKSKLRSDRHDRPGSHGRPPMPPPGYAHRSHSPRPGESPRGSSRGPPRRSGPQRPPTRRPTTSGGTKDKDFDDTMKKLRDMSG